MGFCTFMQLTESFFFLKNLHYFLNFDISSFVSQSLSKFESLVNQIQKNARDIMQRLFTVENCNLFKGPPPQKYDTLPTCKVSIINTLINQFYSL